VAPASGGEKHANPLSVVGPDCEVEIVVRARHFADVEIHRPTAEQPVLDAVFSEQLIEMRQCLS
jgi:hypothetical protein